MANVASRHSGVPQLWGFCPAPPDDQFSPVAGAGRKSDMTIYLPFFVLFALLAFGVPVAISLALSGALGIFLATNADVLVGILTASPGSALSTYELLTIPMFILMAEFMGVSGITNSLFSAVSKWTQKIKDRKSVV